MQLEIGQMKLVQVKQEPEHVTPPVQTGNVPRTAGATVEVSTGFTVSTVSTGVAKMVEAIVQGITDQLDAQLNAKLSEMQLALDKKLALDEKQQTQQQMQQMQQQVQQQMQQQQQMLSQLQQEVDKMRAQVATERDAVGTLRELTLIVDDKVVKMRASNADRDLQVTTLAAQQEQCVKSITALLELTSAVELDIDAKLTGLELAMDSKLKSAIASITAKMRASNADPAAA